MKLTKLGMGQENCRLGQIFGYWPKNSELEGTTTTYI